MADFDDIYWMKKALELAKQAASEDEVPVGALIVVDNQIVGQGYNQREGQKNATLHAEMIAINQACATMGGWRLPNSTLYVTLEPCPMCAGAMLQARINHLVFGAFDYKMGAAGTKINLLQNMGFNHQISIKSSVLAEDSVALLQSFFKAKRQNNK